MKIDENGKFWARKSLIIIIFLKNDISKYFLCIISLSFPPSPAKSDSGQVLFICQCMCPFMSIQLCSHIVAQLASPSRIMNSLCDPLNRQRPFGSQLVQAINSPLTQPQISSIQSTQTVHSVSRAPEGAQQVVALSPTAPVVHDEDAAPAVEEPGATPMPGLMQQTAIALEQLRQLLDTSNQTVPSFSYYYICFLLSKLCNLIF